MEQEKKETKDAEQLAGNYDSLAEREKKLDELTKSFYAEKAAFEETLSEKRITVEKKIAQSRIDGLTAIEQECSSLRKQRMDALENEIATQMDQLNKQKEENQNSLNEFVVMKEKVDQLSLENKTKENTVKDLQDKIAQLSKMEARIADLGGLQSTIQTHEKTIKDLQKEIKEKTALIATLEAKIANQEGVEGANKDLLSQLEARTNEINKYKSLQALLGENSLGGIIIEIQKLHENQAELKKNQAILKQAIADHNFEKEILEKQKAKFSEDNLNVHVEHRMVQKYKSEKADYEDSIKHLKKLREDYLNEKKIDRKIIEDFEDLKSLCNGENPARLIAEYEMIKKELGEALNQLKSTPSELLQKKYADLEEDKRNLQHEYEALKEKEKIYSTAINEKTELEYSLSLKEQECNTLLQHKNFLESENERLLASYENSKNQKERIASINLPYFTKKIPIAPEEGMEEVRWLKQVSQGIKNYGIEFPDRLLFAFHTALKTAEMSPLTVLAGVSGTGKSLLPRLYAHFGGINFLAIPVAPNWDCQEAMLGYYNSIDNCFDAQPALRFLAQTQRSENEQNGFIDVMNMILLDEMNLANVELYFSEFLSKLEVRRDYKDSDDNMPKLQVKIGSKMPDWELRLGRNVLWTGTMNQDETTKTLSDKVLDRGIVINFPSPKNLIGRENSHTLAAPSNLLKKTNWQNWQKEANPLDDKALEKFKESVESINTELNKVGRALGHRVWQSIEAYMRLHPDVMHSTEDKNRKLALTRAFEDQVVQKIMPKLRGLETRGAQGEVLDEIEVLIPENLKADFAKAKDQGFGQFMWCSSNYIYTDPDSLVLDKKLNQDASDAIPTQEQKNTWPEANKKLMLELLKNHITENGFTQKVINDLIKKHGWKQDDAEKIVKDFFTELLEKVHLYVEEFRSSKNQENEIVNKLIEVDGIDQIIAQKLTKAALEKKAERAE
ncbi:MAG: hypothetical protein ACRC5H_10425 [Treponemataceae bacterium]